MHSNVPKQKLTYILHSIAVGGVEVALISAIPALTKKYDLNVIVLGEIDPRMIQHLTDDEKGVFTKFNYPLHLFPFFLPKIARHILRRKPDLLIASLWRASLTALVTRAIDRRPTFYAFVHNTNFPHRFAHFFIKKAATNADVVLADSFATSEFVKQDFRPKAQVRVVSFLTRPTPRLSNRPVPSGDGEVRFMFLGRISKTKNLPGAIKVISTLRSRGINARLDVYGRDDDGSLAELRSLVAGNGLEKYVHFMGEVQGDQKWTLFSAYHFYIQLSLSEGMAMSVTEAMQNGLVCVVSPVGEIVHYAKDMHSAIIIDIFRNSWDDQIEKVYQTILDGDLYSRISTNGHARFSNQPLYSESLMEQIQLK